MCCQHFQINKKRFIWLKMETPEKLFFASTLRGIPVLSPATEKQNQTQNDRFLLILQRGSLISFTVSVAKDQDIMHYHIKCL